MTKNTIEDECIVFCNENLDSPMTKEKIDKENKAYALAVQQKETEYIISIDGCHDCETIRKNTWDSNTNKYDNGNVNMFYNTDDYGNFIPYKLPLIQCRKCKGGRRYQSEIRQKEKVAANPNILLHLTTKERFEIRKAADYICAICKKTDEKSAVDHCHQTGKIRGVLCMSCNLALGFFKDDIETMQKAINYLKEFAIK